MPKLSAAEAISPAIEHARKLLMEPFRWGVWLRYAVLGLFVQQFGCNANFNSFNSLGNLGKQPTAPVPSNEFLALGRLPGILGSPALTAGLIVTLMALFMLLVLVHMYIGSVSRFILFDSVLHGSCRLREGWNRWHSQGLRLFGLQLLVTVISLTAAFVIFGIPLIAIVSAAGFKSGGAAPNLAGLGAGIVVFVLFAIPLVFAFAIVAFALQTLIGDFAVPIMMLEDTGAMASLGRAWRMARAEKGGYIFYWFMRFVMVIAAAIIFAIIGFVVTLVALIPIGGIAAVVLLAGKAAGLGWTVFTISAAVIAGLILLLPFMYLLSLVRTPGTVFFPAYAIHFFAGRYPPLGAIVYPPLPPPPPPPSAPPLPEPVMETPQAPTSDAAPAAAVAPTANEGAGNEAEAEAEDEPPFANP